MFSSSRLIHSLIVHVNRDYVVSTYSHEVLTTLWREFRKAYKSEKEFEKKLKRGIGKIKVDGLLNQNNDCGICLDTPDYNNMVTTSCGHHFCKGCYKKWVIEYFTKHDKKKLPWLKKCPENRYGSTIGALCKISLSGVVSSTL